MNAAFLAAAGSPASILPPRTIPRARFNPFAPPSTTPNAHHDDHPPGDSELHDAPPAAQSSTLDPTPSPLSTQNSVLSTSLRLASRDYSALAALAHALYHRNLERIAEADLRGQPPDDETLRRLDLLRRQFVSAASIDLRERTLNARLARDAQAAARRADVHASYTTAARTAADRSRHDPPDDDIDFDDDATTEAATENTRPPRARSRSRSRSRAHDLPLLPVNPADITPPPLEDDDFAPASPPPGNPPPSALESSESASIRADPCPLPSSCDSRLASRDSPVPTQHSAPSTQHFPAAPP